MQKVKNSFILKWTLLLLFNTSISFAQEIEWQNTIGGSGDDQLKSIKQTVDGGFILGGWSLSNISGDKTEDSNGLFDYWIVKVDPYGVIQWQNTIGGNNSDYLTSVCQTTDGGYLLGGVSGSNVSGDKSDNCIGNYDYWIVKVDSSGMIQWQKTIGGSDTDELFSLQQTNDGGYILGGSSRSSISGNKTDIGSGNGSDDFWIVKVDSIGNIQWQNAIGGFGQDDLTSIQQTSDGGYILGGHSTSNISIDKTENRIGLEDLWIVKIDAIGNIQWQKTLGGLGNEWMRDLQETNDAGYILGGISNSNISGDKSENSMGGWDYWIIKVDSMGVMQWQNAIGSLSDDWLNSIQQTVDSGYVLCGESAANISGDKAEKSNGESDFWLVKIDQIGNIQWQNAIGGLIHEYNNFAIETIDRKLFLGGVSISNISGDKLENCQGNGDFWIFKLTSEYNLIQGKVFADLNSNGIQDAGEPHLIGHKITEQNTGRFAFTEQNGNYSVSVLDTGSFTVSSQSVNLFGPTPSTQSASFNGINQKDSLNDFAFQPQGTFEDVCIKITPLGNFRSGFDAYYQIEYGNFGNTTVVPTVYFYPYSNVTFQSATLTPSNVTPYPSDQLHFIADKDKKVKRIKEGVLSIY